MQPQSPTPQYDFIFNGAQTQPKKPALGGVPKPVLFIIGAVILIVIIIVWSSLSGSKGADTKALIEAAGRAREIARISDLVSAQSKDANTQALAATVKTSLSSEQTQLTGYLSERGKKVSTKELDAYKNSSADSQLQSAAQNNSLESAYYTYLKTNLGSYKSDLSSVYSSASDKLKPILNDAYKNASLILTSPPVKGS